MQEKEILNTSYYFSKAALLPYPKKITLRDRVALFFHRVGKRWDKAKKRFLLQHNVWRGGNLLILLMTLSVLAFTLAFSDEPLLEENREEAQHNVWEQDDLSFPLVQEIPEKNGSYPPSDEETSHDKTRQNTVWYPLYSAYVFNESLLKAYGEDNENKSSEQRDPVSFSLLSTPPKDRSPATSDEETSEDKRGQNVQGSEQNVLLLGAYGEENESKSWERIESFPFSFHETPQQNSPSATSDDETSYEETPEDDTCQNTFQVR